MNSADVSGRHADYLKRVDRLLIDLEPDEKGSLLANLREQLDEVPEGELGIRLGTPEEFVAEYRRSAGIEGEAGMTRESGPLVTVASVASAVALPFGVLILFSFGGQLVLGPFVLAIEWILARVSPKPLRIVWSVLAGALVGEIVVLSLDMYLFPVDGVLFLLIGVVVAIPVGFLFYRTSSRGTS
jgi:uncharacterized membrane protein